MGHVRTHRSYGCGLLRHGPDDGTRRTLGCRESSAPALGAQVAHHRGPCAHFFHRADRHRTHLEALPGPSSQGTSNGAGHHVDDRSDGRDRISDPSHYSATSAVYHRVGPYRHRSHLFAGYRTPSVGAAVGSSKRCCRLPQDRRPNDPQPRERRLGRGTTQSNCGASTYSPKPHPTTGSDTDTTARCEVGDSSSGVEHPCPRRRVRRDSCPREPERDPHCHHWLERRHRQERLSDIPGRIRQSRPRRGPYIQAQSLRLTMKLTAWGACLQNSISSICGFRSSHS